MSWLFRWDVWALAAAALERRLREYNQRFGATGEEPQAMDRAPVVKQPYGLCEAAGIPVYDFSPILIAICALVLSSALQAHYRAQHPK